MAAVLSEVADFGRKHGLPSAALDELHGLVQTSITLTQKRVTVKVPATIANIGPGLEACGLAVHIWDEFTLEYADQFSLEVFGDNSAEVPRTDQNLVVMGAACAFKEGGRPFPTLRFACTHRIPFSKGLGAAPASFVGGFLAGSVLCSEELVALGISSGSAMFDVTPCSMRRQVSGSVDAGAESGQDEATSVDKLLQLAVSRGWNAGCVCPSVYGALQIGIETGAGWRSHRVPVPSGLVCVLFVPDGHTEGTPLPPKPVARKDAIFNVGRCALLINCFCTGNFEAFQKATEDTLASPHCQAQFPFLKPIIQAAVDAGAAGACVCGYGPSVMALITGRSGDVMAQSASNQLERDVAKAMLDRAGESDVEGQVLIAKPTDSGAHVVADKSALGAAEDVGRISYFQ